MKSVGVLQITDSLAAGGTERMAVNLANALPSHRFRSFLCTTRGGGPLAALLKPEVQRLDLARQQRFDLSALRRLAAFIKAHQIGILHAHSTSLFTATLVSLLPPRPRIVWHDHYGNHEQVARAVWPYRLLVRRVNSIIAVNQSLANWAQSQLHIAAERIRYIPNFVAEPALEGMNSNALPGQPGQRIVCVANLRRQKDHLTLLQALAQVVTHEPEAHLLLAGSIVEPEYFEQVKGEIARLGLAQNVTVLGEHANIAGLLRACDIGVLSSTSEGLPLSLIEYGQAGLAVVCTRVGQCAEVLDDGAAGLLVSPRAPQQLAEALLKLLRSAELRTQLGVRFARLVSERYRAEVVIERICQVYEWVLKDD